MEEPNIHPLAAQICKLLDKDFIMKYEFLKTQLDIVVNKHGKRYRFNEQERRKLVKCKGQLLGLQRNSGCWKCHRFLHKGAQYVFPAGHEYHNSGKVL